MSHKKILTLSGVIAFLLSTIIFVCTFFIFSYFSIFLSYISCGFLLFLTFYVLFTKGYEKDKEGTRLFLAIPFVIGLGLSTSILVQDYSSSALNFDFITKTIIGAVGMISAIIVFTSICLYAYTYNESSEKKSNT